MAFTDPGLVAGSSLVGVQIYFSTVPDPRDIS